MKGKSRHWMWLSLALIAAGSALFFYRWQHLGYPLKPQTESETWVLQARVDVRPTRNKPMQVNLQLPTVTPGYSRLDESFVSRGFGLTIENDPAERVAQWAIRRAQRSQPLYFRTVIYRDPGSPGLSGKPIYPEPEPLEEPFASAVTTLVTDVREQSADTASFTREVLSRLNNPAPDEQVELLLESVRTSTQKVRLVQRILSQGRIPTRMLHGIKITDASRDTSPEVLLAVNNEREWLVFNPSTGEQDLADDFFLWWTGDRPVVDVIGAELEEVSFSVRRSAIDALELAQLGAESRKSGFASWSLLNLPVQTQTAYAILLLVPLGAFVIVILRNFIGVRTFGTFMPVLIALAFRETELVAGFVLFTVVTSLGLSIRFYLEHLRLLLVPRLAAVLTVVVLLMIAVGVFSQKLGWEVGLSITLFPMVILAMIIERMSIVWEERGASEAIVESIGSLIVAVLAYLVMGLALVQHLTFVFPETMLILLGITIACGRYTGYRVSELFRFRELSAMTGEQAAVDTSGITDKRSDKG